MLPEKLVQVKGKARGHIQLVGLGQRFLLLGNDTVLALIAFQGGDYRGGLVHDIPFLRGAAQPLPDGRRVAVQKVLMQNDLLDHFIREHGRILRMVSTEKGVDLIGGLHGLRDPPVVKFILRQFLRLRCLRLQFFQCLRHDTVFLRDVLPVAIVFLIEPAPGVTDIAPVRELAAFLHGNIPAVGLIVDVVFQVLRHLHGLQLVNVIPAQVLIASDIRVHIVAVQVFRQVDQVLDAARVFPHLHGGLELFILALRHVIQL